MSLKLEIGLTQKSKSNATEDRPKVISIINGNETIVNDIAPSSNSIKERLNTIKGEKPPKFKFRWSPPEKHKNLFLNLKKAGKNELSKITFYIFIKDDTQLNWSAIATGTDCEVINFIPGDIQTVEINCGNFDYEEGRN